MSESYDREKIIEHMLDPITSTIVAELEDGEKNSTYLAEKSSISKTEICERLSYLVRHGFIIEKTIGDNSVFSANLDKLSQIIEDGENFGAAVEGLEKMDSFLN